MNSIGKNKSIYVVSFCEGAAVMSAELCGSKILSPYFGSSLYVWAAIIAVTLGSLAAGYFYGGILSERADHRKKLMMILLIASVFTGLMPIISNVFSFLAIGFPLLLAVVLAALSILAAPMVLMGAASPLIIAILSENRTDSGKVSGTVYAVSTLGGIISTFINGFWFIPTLGINSTLLIFSIILSLSVFFFVRKENKITPIIFIFILVVLGLGSKMPSKNCIYENDGILGKINVIDDTISEEGKIKIVRKLLVNNVVQTEMNMINAQSVSGYISIVDSNILRTSNKKALVLGLGGGLTSNMFVNKGYETYGVDLDSRIIEVAKKYFLLNQNVSVFSDDARHFINNEKRIYDLILLDLFKAEEQPAHTITLESFNELKKHLTANGMLIINWHGYISGDKGAGTRILLNTLSKSGFSYKLCALSDNEDYRNIVIFAGLQPLTHLQYEISDKILPGELLNTDNCPLIEKYNVLANLSWRKNYIQYYYSAD